MAIKPGYLIAAAGAAAAGWYFFLRKKPIVFTKLIVSQITATSANLWAEGTIQHGYTKDNYGFHVWKNGVSTSNEMVGWNSAADPVYDLSFGWGGAAYTLSPQSDITVQGFIVSAGKEYTSGKYTFRTL